MGLTTWKKSPDGPIRKSDVSVAKNNRIYFGAVGDELIILLCGGDKSSQDRDIRKAKESWSDYRSKNHE